MTMRSFELGKEPSVLCVDDQPIILQCIMGTLQGLGEVCIGKLNGPDAIELVQDRLQL